MVAQTWYMVTFGFSTEQKEYAFTCSRQGGNAYILRPKLDICNVLISTAYLQRSLLLLLLSCGQLACLLTGIALVQYTYNFYITSCSS